MYKWWMTGIPPSKLEKIYIHVAKTTTLCAELNALCTCQALRGHLADHDLQGYNQFVISKQTLREDFSILSSSEDSGAFEHI